MRAPAQLGNRSMISIAPAHNNITSQNMDWHSRRLARSASCCSQRRGVRRAQRTGSTQRGRGGRDVGFGHMMRCAAFFFNSIGIECHQASMSCRVSGYNVILGFVCNFSIFIFCAYIDNTLLSLSKGPNSCDSTLIWTASPYFCSDAEICDTFYMVS